MSRLAWVTGGGANSGSEASLACGRTTAAYKFDGSELVLVSAGNVRAGDLWHGAARIIAEAQRTEIGKDSGDATQWFKISGATAVDTLSDWGDLKRVAIGSAGEAGIVQNNGELLPHLNVILSRFFGSLAHQVRLRQKYIQQPTAQ